MDFYFCLLVKVVFRKFISLALPINYALTIYVCGQPQDLEAI